MKKKRLKFKTIFLDLRIGEEELKNILNALKKHNPFYDENTKIIKTTASKTMIKKLSKKFKGIQSY